jgi:hypothetical protein
MSLSSAKIADLAAFMPKEPSKKLITILIVPLALFLCHSSYYFCPLEAHK